MRQHDDGDRAAPHAPRPAPAKPTHAVSGAAAALHLQRSAGNRAVARLIDDASELAVPTSGGQPLAGELRSFMESRLGADFSSVRVHTDGPAAASARAFQARAYTAGEHVVFNQGAYRPDTPEGRHTLAHELTHVLQQRSGPVDGTPIGGGVKVSHPDDRFERAAEATARAAVQRDLGDDTDER